MNNIREFLKKQNTAQDFTVEEVIEFLESDIESMASELETAQALQKNEVVISQGEFHNLIVDLKQAVDKLKEINEEKQ